MDHVIQINPIKTFGRILRGESLQFSVQWIQNITVTVGMALTQSLLSNFVHVLFV